MVCCVRVCVCVCVCVCVDGGLVLEVDRFDPGRPVEREGEGEGGMVPTALIPGDIAIPSQVKSTPCRSACCALHAHSLK